MFSTDELDQIVAAMRLNGVRRLDLRDGRSGLRFDLGEGSTQPAVAAPTAVSAAPARAGIAVRSPGIGTFCPRGADDGLPALEPDQKIAEGEVLGYLGQGAVRLLVTAPAAGRLCTDMPAAGTVFGFGDTVLTLERYE